MNGPSELENDGHGEVLEHLLNGGSETLFLSASESGLVPFPTIDDGEEGCLRAWDPLVDDIVGLLCDLDEMADDLDAHGAHEMANVVGPLGIAMQMLARRLLGRRRTTRPSDRRRVFFARAATGGSIWVGSTVDIPHALAALTRREGASVQLLGWLRGDAALIRTLRARFAMSADEDQAVAGWLEPTADLLRYIEAETNHGEPD